MFFGEVKDEIESAIEYELSVMPEDIKLLIRKLNVDLTFGPTYYDENLELCDCFDDGAVAFNFSVALKRVGEYCHANIHDLKFTESYGVENPYFGEEGEPEYLEIEEEYEVDGSAKEIMRGLLGKELASMI